MTPPALPSNRGRRGDVRASERAVGAAPGARVLRRRLQRGSATAPRPPPPPGPDLRETGEPGAGGGGGSGSAPSAPPPPSFLLVSGRPPRSPVPAAARALAPPPGPGCWGVPCGPPLGDPRLSGGAMASESVKVVVRCRPMNQRERELNCHPVVTVDSARGQCFIQNPGAADQPPKQFTFDGAYYMDHFTEQIYNEIAYPLVEVRAPASPGDPLGRTWGPSEGS